MAWWRAGSTSSPSRTSGSILRTSSCRWRYYDHPVHAPHDHTVNIDFLNPALGPSARVAVELTEEAALALVDAIRSALAAAPPGLASSGQAAPAAR